MSMRIVVNLEKIILGKRWPGHWKLLWKSWKNLEQWKRRRNAIPVEWMGEQSLKNQKMHSNLYCCIQVYIYILIVYVHSMCICAYINIYIYILYYTITLYIYISLSSFYVYAFNHIFQYMYLAFYRSTFSRLFTGPPHERPSSALPSLGAEMMRSATFRHNVNGTDLKLIR